MAMAQCSSRSDLDLCRRGGLGYWSDRDPLNRRGRAHLRDGRGRFLDNVFIERLWRSLKHEDVYLNGYADGREARAGIASWIKRRARPLGSLEHARAISLASFSPSKIATTGGVMRGLRLTTASKPSSTNCLPTR